MIWTLNRIHLGIMGGALAHATYGWFGGVPEEEAIPLDILAVDLRIAQITDFETEL